MSSPIVTRFAPSPTGRLHLGHAYSALFAFETARRASGRFILRIEDIDFTRCRPEAEAAILEDLNWLQIEWEQPVRRQSEHLDEYAAVADSLRSRGFLYPCFCTRKDIQREIEAAGGAPHGSDGPVYPGICRHLSDNERAARIRAGEAFALRLDVARAMEAITVSRFELTWRDLQQGTQAAQPELLGDVVLMRKDIGCSYHLAVVIDDAQQGVTRITRGMDLFDATHVQRLIQALLGLPTPEYYHHTLVCDEQGQRLAKRNDAETLQSLRQRGVTVQEIRDRLKIENL